VKVSALIPTYNRRDYICRAIQSVLAQSLPVDEIIVVDDGSTDGTGEYLKQRYGDRVAVVRQQNQGVGVARRRAVAEARGDWVAFLDSDDEWLPDRNAAFVRAADVLPPNVAWIFGDTFFVTELHGEGVSIFRAHAVEVKTSPEILPRNFVGPAWNPARPACALIQSAFIKRSAIVALDCFREGLRHSEDFVAAMRVASRYSFAAIPNVVTRLHRTADLEQSSTELGELYSLDQYTGRLLGSEIGARSAGRNPWGKIHEEMVRSICKIRMKEKLPIRRLAFDQFKFGVSMKSLVFFAAALCGPSMIRAGLVTKQRMRGLRSSMEL
jgi:glycosyltransferase involved in cell wall biosynthesis